MKPIKTRISFTKVPKKKPAKRKYDDKQGTLIGKLIDLKYRINEAYRSYPHETNKNDKDYVMSLIESIRNGVKLTKDNMMTANNLWKQYHGSRMKIGSSYVK